MLEVIYFFHFFLVFVKTCFCVFDENVDHKRETGVVKARIDNRKASEDFKSTAGRRRCEDYRYFLCPNERSY